MATKKKVTKAKEPATKAKPKNKCGHSTKSRARPRVELCEEQIKRFAALGTPTEKIAEFFDVSCSTLRANFSAALKEGRKNIDTRLRQAQLDVALEKLDTKMLIWLGKQYLGQRDKIESEVTHVGDISMLVQE